jgi:SanA protein
MIVIPRIIRNSVQPLIFTVDQVPNHEVAIVFGAGLWRDGRPTAVLRDRVQTAVDLYKSGKVIKLLMSGDNRFINYNEPKAMYETALALGVPKEDIVLDYAGRRTYDTCYRAKYIFGIDEAILITQSFHLPRAIYTCQKLGISPNGVPADLRVYRRFASWYWNIRESFAILNALIELHVTHPVPVLGQPEPIFPKELE